MPELPEVEVLVRHLARLLKNRTIQDVKVRRVRVLRPSTELELNRALRGAKFAGLRRRGKFLLFTLRRPAGRLTFPLLGHLGMSGRMYLQPAAAPLPKHAAAVLFLGNRNFVFEDTRYFGRLTLDTSPLVALGPEPLGEKFTTDYFASALAGSMQPIKVKLLDQTLVAGIGNIYASEALFLAGVSPRLPARRLSRKQTGRLRRSIRKVLSDAIRFGSTVPLDWAGAARKDGLFYYGKAEEAAADFYTERLRVYDRAGQACRRCGKAIRCIVLAGRSTFYCPCCQRV